MDGRASGILRVLKEYDRPLPIEFLIRMIGRSRDETRLSIETLREKGIIAVDGDSVRLVVRKQA
jgi:DNA-binding IclR family transcriptional regulator